MGNFAGGIFLPGGGNRRKIELDHSNVFKAINNICKYSTSIKFKINMTYIYIEYEIKIEMVMTTAKSEVFFWVIT